MENRNNMLDILKGAAILNIIFIHTVWWTGTEYVPDILRSLSLLVDVPLFFFLSGWATTLKPKIVYKPFKRIIKLYIPYITMLLILILSLWAVYGRSPSIHDFSKWFLFLNYNSYEIPVVMGSMWFLIVFLFITLCTPLLLKISQKRDMSYILILLLSGISLLYTFNKDFANFNLYPTVSLRVFLFYLLFYFMGIYFSRYQLSFSSMAKLVLAILLLLGCMSISIYQSTFDLQNNKFPPSSFYLLASLLSVVISLYLKNFEAAATNRLKKSFLLKFLRFSGQNVFFVYLYQGFGSSAISIIVHYFRNHGMLVHWVPILILCFICNILFTYLMVIVARFINKKVSFIY